MVADTSDNAFSFLLRTMIPLIVAPIGPLPPTGVQLRGVVRADDERVRVVLSADARMTSGLAIEFDLARDAEASTVKPIMDHVRAGVAPQMDELLRIHPQTRDSHSNIVVPASATGFRPAAQPAHYDQALFSVFSLFVHGGGFPWFEEDYTFGGFMFRSDRICRIYVKVTATDAVYGFDAPINGPHGPGTYGYGLLPQELAPLARTGDLAAKPVVDDTDDYCVAVVDLSSWVGTVG
ncbi:MULTISPECIES: hypothetical protein [unclassified Nocardia]|uniref:hypothetical protein n=1 Tax=unclassified Nocardia TaxID=2637762 RepID=UPI001CE46697|nr:MULTISPECIES: hypothetical protein [unclassified Nocardia]